MKNMATNRSIRLVALVLLLALVAGCQPVAVPVAEQAETATAAATSSPALAANLRTGCVETYDPTVDYFPAKATVDYSEVWTIEYHNSYKVISVLNPWRGAEQTFDYVLVQCGTPAPDGYDGAQVIQVPVDGVMTMSSTQIPHLLKLGRLDALLGMDSFDYVTAPEVLAKIAAGTVAEIGSQSAVDVEQVINAEADLVMTYGYGDPQYDAHPKLLEAGVPVALNSDYMESSPLGRSEWIEFTAAFFNDEALANAEIAAIAERYDALAKLAQAAETRPTVFLGAARDDKWSMPGGNGYVARFLEDAGAAYLWAEDESTGNIPLDFETVFAAAHNADYWLNTSSWQSLADGLAADARYAEFDAFQPGRIFNNNLRLNDRGGNDYWERGIANPDEVLADLVSIFYPELLPDHSLIFYRALE